MTMRAATPAQRYAIHMSPQLVTPANVDLTCRMHLALSPCLNSLAPLTFHSSPKPPSEPLSRISCAVQCVPCDAGIIFIAKRTFEMHFLPAKSSTQLPRKASKRLYVYPMNGRLSVVSSPPWFKPASVCARSCAELSTCGISSIGKYWVSTLLCSFGSKGARILRRPSHCTPWKNGCAFNSAAP